MSGLAFSLWIILTLSIAPGFANDDDGEDPICGVDESFVPSSNGNGKAYRVLTEKKDAGSQRQECEEFGSSTCNHPY